MDILLSADYLDLYLCRVVEFCYQVPLEQRVQLGRAAHQEIPVLQVTGVLQVKQGQTVRRVRQELQAQRVNIR